MTTTHTRTRSRLFAAGACALLSTALLTATPARSALPRVLDRVPADALGVAAFHSLERVDKGARDLLGAIEMPAMSTPAQILAVMGLGDGLDMKRGAAVAVLPAAGAAEQAPAGPAYHIVALLPVTDFDALLANFEPEVGQGGVRSFVVNGQQVFARPVDGGFALLGDSADAIAGFDAGGGNLAAHEAALGAAGRRVADDSDVFLVLGPAAMRTITDQALTQAQGQMQMAAMMAGGDAAELQQSVQAAQTFANEVIGAATASIVGLRAGPLGARFDFALNFREGTQAAQTLQIKGDSAELLARLPDQPFLLAGAGDYSSPAIKELFHKATALAAGDAAPAQAGDAIDASDGQALAVYTTPGGLLTGLFANSIEITVTGNPAGLLQSTRQMLEQLGQQEGALFTGAFTENAAEIAGVSAHRWSMTMNPAAGGFGPQQQVVGALFGQMGLSGYIAPVKGGVIRTLAPNSASLEQAIALNNNGQGASLARNARLAAVARELPQGRTAEGYVNVGELLRQALVMAATFLGQVNLDVPANLPPVGMSVTTDAGGVRFTTFAPAPVIKTIVRVAQVVQQMQQGAGNGGRPPF